MFRKKNLRWAKNRFQVFFKIFFETIPYEDGHYLY